MYEFPVSFLCFYLKGKVQIDSDFVHYKIPNTILGLIPMGASEESIPLKSISNVKIENRTNLKSLIIGAFIAFLGVISFVDSILLALILLAIGVNMATNAIQLYIEVEKTELQLLYIFLFMKARKQVK